MKKQIIQRLSLLLVLLFGAISSGMAADRIQIETAGIEPGETVAVPFSLENDQTFYGFQLDLAFPEGLEVVQKNGKADVTLSSRFDSSFQLVTNVLADGKLRVLAFSTSHQAITGNSGALFYIKVNAADNFTGGQLSASNIRMVGEGDRDVALPDVSVELGTKHNNQFYIQDFKMAVGETKTASLILDNETEFTAFQTDLYLPEGISIVPNSAKMTSRGAASHSISMKSFSDGRTRIACLSPNSDSFTGNSGALITIDFTANKDAAKTSKIQMKNQIFVTPHVKEYRLPNSECTVTTERALVESITIEPTLLDLTEGNSQQLTTTVLPTFASTKDVEWSSSAPDVAIVSATGLVTALKPGGCIITAVAVDGSGVTATCPVTVTEIPVSSVSLNRSAATLKATETVQLTASVYPANASNKNIVWGTSNEKIATVSESGLVTAVAVGEVCIFAYSQSTPENSDFCEVSVVSTPVASITLSQTSVSLKAREKVSLTATIAPETATVKDIIWTSSNPEVAAVDENGIITALAVGSTSVSANAADNNGAMSTCQVTVVPTHAESITINTPASTTFKVGERISLDIQILPETTTDKSVTWSTSNAGIATVDTEGSVTAVGVGTVEITATTANGKTSTITLTVESTTAENITLTPTTASILIGESIPILVSVLPATTTDKSVSWTSSNPAIASVDESGKVTGLAVGNVEITATTVDGSSLKAVSKITVNPILAQSVDIDYDGQTNLYVGATAQLSATILPENTTDKTIVWRSLNPTVASVSETGLVTALTLGDATITATTPNGQSSQIKFVIVPNPVTAITLDKTSVELKATETVKVIATATPEDATNKNISWTSSNNAVATVDADGAITAIAVGNAAITAAATDGSGVSATCNISVIATPADGVTIETPDKTMFKVSEIIQLNATVLPTTTTDKSITWTTSNPEVATVDENGKVTAVAIGTVTITATTSNGKTYTVTLTVEPTHATALTLNRTSASLKVTNTLQLSAMFTPVTTTNKTVEWSTSNANIATVNANGLVTAKALGTCIITATAKDGSEVSASCELTVGETAAESITITPTGPFTIKTGETVSLSATVLPETTTDKSVSWLAQTGAVKVDQNGLVTGLAVGESWVSATNSAGQEAYVNFTVLPVLIESIDVINPISLEVGQTQQIHAVVSPSNATNTVLKWSVKDSSIAAVDNNGNITALKIGSTEIIIAATDGSGVAAKIEINVVPTIATGISIETPVKSVFKAGETIQLAAVVTPENTTDKTVTWTTSNSDVAIVNENGLVSAVGVGTVTITATNSAGQKASVDLTVEKTIAESIVLSTTSVQLKVGEESKLTVFFKPSTITDKSLTWSSSNSEVVTISETGIIKAIALGEAIVTAKTNDGSNLSVTCDVNVVPTPVESVVIDYDGSTTLKVGDKVQLSAKILPEDATDKTLTWQTQTDAVVSVDQNGLVTANGLGEAWVGAFATGNHPYAVVNFKVEETPVSSIELIPGSVNLKAGETASIQAKVLPKTATVKTLSWNSNNPDIATVDQYGNITAIAVGRTKVNARATDGSGVIQTIAVDVVDTYAESVTISATGPTTLKDGETVVLSAVVLPETTTDKTIAWSSSDETIATVVDGVVTAHAKVGTAVITATTNNSVKATIDIDVIATPVESVEILSEKLVMIPGESANVYLSLNPTTATDKTITWTVSDESVIKIQKFDSSVAVISAIAPGQAYLNAEASNGIKASLMLTVNSIPITDIHLSNHALKFNVSETYQFEANVLPENASNKAIRWESSNAEIGSIDETGLFTALSPGETIITCYATDESGVSAQCQTIVVQPVTSIVLNEHNLELEKDKGLQLIATIEPVNATDKSVVWSSSEPETVSVDDTGLIEALKEGEAIISVATLDGSALEDKCKVTVSIITGIKKIIVDDIKVSVNNNTLIVEHGSYLIPVRLYKIDGTEILATSKMGKQVLFSNLETGYYIISFGKRALKIKI